MHKALMGLLKFGGYFMVMAERHPRGAKLLWHVALLMTLPDLINACVQAGNLYLRIA